MSIDKIRMKNNEKEKKIYRLTYVFVFVLISVFTFILPKHDRSWFGKLSNDFLGDTIFTVSYFQVCKNTRWNCDPVFIDAALSPKVINLNGVIVPAEDFRRKKYFRGGYDPYSTKNNSYEALNKWNQKNPENIIFKPDQLILKKKLRTYNAILNYLLFFTAIALIWKSRNLSISIVNSVASIISKGWKKI